MSETLEAMGLMAKAHKIDEGFYDIRKFSDRAIDVLPASDNFIGWPSQLLIADAKARLPISIN